MPFDFKPNQAPSKLLPGERPGDFPDPLGVKAGNRAAREKRRITEIIDGKKPALDSSERADKYLESQIAVMAESGYLPQPVDNYITTPSSAHGIVMGYSPMPAELVKDQEQIEHALGMKGNTKLRVLGTGFEARNGDDISKTFHNRDLLIACAGDLHTARELAQVIEHKRTQATEKKPGHAAFIPPLIIENSNNFWDNTLIPTKLMKIEENAPASKRRQYINLDALASHYGIYITESRDQTLALADNLLEGAEKKHTAKARPKPLPKPIVPPGSVIFVATSTQKKYDEMVNIYKQQGLDVKFRRIEHLLNGSFNSPDEDQFSYEGNAAKKMDAAFEAWDKMSQKDKEERLAKLGFNMHNAFILTEDSGFHFNQPGLEAEPEFRDLPSKIKPGQPFPGTETGPATIGMMGTRSFFQKVNAIYERREADQGKKLDRIVHQKAIIALAPLEGNRWKHLDKVYMMSAASNARFTKAPLPGDNGVEMDNFLVPITPLNPEEKTEAQLGKDWLAINSRRAMAWHALAYEAGIAKDRKHEPDYEKEFTAGLVIDGMHPSAQVARLLEKRAKEEGFSYKALSPNSNTLRHIQTKILEHADGIVLAFDPKKAQEDFWRNMWIVSSLVVGEQTRDKYKLGKPMYLVNRKDEAGVGAFDHIERLIADLHLLGTIPQDPDTLIKPVSNIEEGIEALKKDRLEYHRFDPPSYSLKSDPIIKQQGVKSHKSFNVAIFTSATNENASLVGINEELTRRLIEEGFGAFSGAGVNAGMGGITRTAHKMGDEFDAHHTGVTTPHIQEKETGGKPVEEYLDHFTLTRDIYGRVEHLLEADAVVLAPGGMGTVQELAAFAVLKQRALRNPENERLAAFKDKEVVILNSQVDVEGKKRGFYDVLIKVIPPDQLEGLGIHVRSTVEEVVDKMKELRDRKLDKPARRGAVRPQDERRL